MAFKYSPHWAHDPKPDPNRCPASVSTGGRSLESHQCFSRPTRDGWCMIHHPDAERDRDARNSRKYHEKLAKRDAPRRRLERCQDLVVEIAKEPCDMGVCNNAHTPLFKAGTFCLPCRARALLKEGRT